MTPPEEPGSDEERPSSGKTGEGKHIEDRKGTRAMMQKNTVGRTENGETFSTGGTSKSRRGDGRIPADNQRYDRLLTVL